MFIFGWPSFVGGADTKLAHLLVLLHKTCRVTVVPNDIRQLSNAYWTATMKTLGISFCSFPELPSRLEGFGLAMCNECFFLQRIAHRAKDKGLKILWSSDMMWHHPGELEAVHEGIIDFVLYTSSLQKEVLSEGYGDLPSMVTGNYIEAAFFPFKERRHSTFTIGRLSRAAPEKYPEDFPAFYECLELPECRFRVMAWDEALQRKYRWHNFDDGWELLKSGAEAQVDFLHSLDLFVYPLGHKFVESWGRSTVEAMLTGCVPLVPPGHHLENLIVDGESGFICHDFLEYQQHAQEMFRDRKKRLTISRQCGEHARNRLCNKDEHLALWMKVFSHAS